MTRARVRVAGLLATFLLATAPAGATEITPAQLQDLAADARTDPRSLAELREVTTVDGQPADLRGALAGAEDDDLRHRLDELAGGVLENDSGGSLAGAAGPAAREIVEDRKYTGTDLPRPFKALFDWIGGVIEPVVDAISDAIRSVPGPPEIIYALLGAIALGLAVWGFTRIAGRRAGAGTVDRRAPATGAEIRDDLSALERDAAAAERAGDYERAVRLRFRAGLLALDRRGVLVYRSSLTTGDVSRTLASPRFDEVGLSFDRIVYGRVPAAAEDATFAREGWQDVLAGVGSPG